MNSKPRNFHTSPLYLRLNILRLHCKILLENCPLISKAINNFSSSLFDNWFTFASEIHRYETSSSAKGLLKIPTISTKGYGKYSVKTSSHTLDYSYTLEKGLLLLLHTFFINTKF